MTLEQPPDRPQMLSEAPLSRNHLSHLYEVSRAHINRLLADAEADGLLTCPTPTRVVFSRALSDDFEKTVAFSIQLNRAAFAATLATAMEATPSQDQASAPANPAVSPLAASGRQA
jgi:hypothetical protein